MVAADGGIKCDNQFSNPTHRLPSTWELTFQTGKATSPASQEGSSVGFFSQYLCYSRPVSSPSQHLCLTVVISFYLKDLAKPAPDPVLAGSMGGADVYVNPSLD